MTNSSNEKLRDKTLAELYEQFSASSASTSEPWDPPILFDEIATPDISANFLPGVLGEFAHALAHATETPEALAVMVILGVISVAATTRFNVSPKAGWQESVNIYTLVALPPANHKSLVLKSCLQPLIEWEQEQRILREAEIKRQRSERKTQEQIIDSLRRKVGKENDLIQRRQLIQEIAELEANLITPAALPLLFANDTTPEALANHTFEQGGRFAIFSDERGITETLAGLYSNGHANVDILLKGIDGGDLRIYRKDHQFHLNPFLTIVLTVQPAVIQKMAAKHAFSGNGLLERFLYVIPQSKLGYRTHDKPAVATTLQKAFNQEIKSLLDINSHIEKGGNEQPKLLTLSSEALITWQQFQTQVEVKLRPQGELALCPGWGGKLAGFTLRLAALLHIAEYAEQLVTISAKTMMAATAIASRLIPHAVAAYSLMGVDQATADAKDIFQWIQTLLAVTFKQSELCYAMRNRKLGKGERLAKAMNVLIERNLIRAERLPTRKPTLLFHIHPALRDTQSN